MFSLRFGQVEDLQLMIYIVSGLVQIKQNKIAKFEKKRKLKSVK